MRRRLILAGTIALSSLLPLIASAAIFDVTTSMELQDALDAAAVNGEDDVIRLPEETFLATDTFEYTSSEPHDLAIQGPESGRATLSGSLMVQVLSIRTTGGSDASRIGISLSNLSIERGNSGLFQGGGLSILAKYADVTVEDCSFVANRSEGTWGGGARIEAEEFGRGSATIRGSRFEGNGAPIGAGLYVSLSEITLESNVFNDNGNRGTCDGGGAWLRGSPGPVTVTGNSFTRNKSESDAGSCRGGGLYLRAGGTRNTSVESNVFQGNLLGSDGSGAGAYISRVDGPLDVTANQFQENLIGGTGSTGGGGGLRASLFGSFAEVSILNNAFVGNGSGQLGAAAWIDSLDTAIEFSNNTAIQNHAPNSRSDAVRLDAPTASLHNNIVRQNPVDNDVLVVDRSFGTGTVVLKHNNMETWSAPDPPLPDTIDYVPALDVPPGLNAYPDIHLTSSDSPAVDAGIAYAGSPPVDIDGDDRVVDGKRDGEAKIDIGADELDARAILTPNPVLYTSEETLDALGGFAYPDWYIRAILTNVGGLALEINRIYLAESGGLPDTDWELRSTNLEGSEVSPGEWTAISVTYWALSGEDSTNTLIVETSAGTVSAELIGSYVRLPDGDRDNLPDEIESGPDGDDADYDGNCDGEPDRLQSHVASLRTRRNSDSDSYYATIVAPMVPIGELGEAFPAELTPLLQRVRAVPSDEGGRIGAGASSGPYEGLSFQVTTTLLDANVGGDFPVSIILAEDGPTIGGYSKNGPTPNGWLGDLDSRGAGWVGMYDFTLPSTDHVDMMGGEVGAVVERDVRFPCLDSGDVLAHRDVIHLRLKDGRLGDADLLANNVVAEPGTPVVLLADDRDRDLVRDDEDNCPDIPNFYQQDIDGDAVGDACTCGYASASGVPLPGDANRDSRVNGADYTLWADHFGMRDPRFEEGDFNCDGATDGADYTLWADNFGAEKLPVRTDAGGTGGAAASAAQAPAACGLGPELAVLLPALLGISVALRRRAGKRDTW